MAIPNKSEFGPFVGVWLRSRPMHLVRRSLIIAFILLAVSVPAFLDSPKSALVARYRSAGFSALHSGNPVAADLYFRRLGRLDPTDEEGRLGMALAAEDRDNFPLANRLMCDLAFGESNYPMAHHWLAENIIRENTDTLSDEDFWRVRKHLEVALTDGVVKTRCHSVLGSILLNRGETHEAIRHLEEAVRDYPELGIPLFHAYQEIGDAEKAQATSMQVLNAFRQANLSAPGDAEVCLIRVQCELLAGKIGTAERVLKRAIARFPEEPRFSQTLIHLHTEASDRAMQSGDYASSMKHLGEASRLAPGSPRVIARFGRLGGKSDEHTAEVIEALQSVVASGEAASVSHLALGEIMLRQNRIPEAAKHFELGLQHDSKNLALLNNLAWSLIHNENPNPEKALILIDAAVGCRDQNPAKHAEVLDTRGQILATLGRWEEAIVDMEKALPHLSNPDATHETLATAYDEIGEPKLAAIHRKRLRLRTARRKNLNRAKH